jgi:hypothetical protein
LYRVSKGWVAGVALVGFLLFTALVLPGQAEVAEAESGGAGSPDTSFFYTPQELYRTAEAYGEVGRAAYVRARFTFDLIWPLVYTAFLTTAISWVYGKVLPPDSVWRYANLAPVLGMGFDVLENLSTSIVMLRYPQHTPGIDLLAPVFTMLKWGFIGASFALLVTGGVVGLWRVLVAPQRREGRKEKP